MDSKNELIKCPKCGHIQKGINYNPFPWMGEMYGKCEECENITNLTEWTNELIPEKDIKVACYNCENQLTCYKSKPTKDNVYTCDAFEFIEKEPNLK